MTQLNEKKYRCFFEVEAAFSRSNQTNEEDCGYKLSYNDKREFTTPAGEGFTLRDFNKYFIDRLINDQIRNNKNPDEDINSNTVKIHTITASVSLYAIERITTIDNEDRFPTNADYWWKTQIFVMSYRKKDKNCEFVLPDYVYQFSHKLPIGNESPILLRIMLTQLHPCTPKSDTIFKKFSVMLTQGDPFPSLSGYISFKQ